MLDKNFSAVGLLVALVSGVSGVAGFAAHAFAESAVTPAPPSRLEYQIDTTLTLIDAASPPRLTGVTTGLNQPLLMDPTKTTTEERPRALGLSLARAQFQWHVDDATALTLVLRPDAATSRSAVEPQPVAREWDRRAGTTYKPMPRVQVLDAYELSMLSIDAAQLGVGVYENMDIDRSAYPEVLEFGLNVHFPEKFSAFSFNWNPRARAIESLGARHFFANFKAIQGHEDRAEVWDTSASKTYDVGPTADDSYYMGAAVLGFQWGDDVELAAYTFVGDATVQQTGLPDGKRNETDMGGYLVAHTPAEMPLRIKGVFDLRFSHEKWNLGAVAHSPLTQRSVGLTTSTELAHQLWWLLGYHRGDSQILAAKDVSASLMQQGEQYEAGIQYLFGSTMRVAFLAAEEHRIVVDDVASSRSGAFGGTGGDTPTVRRFGLEVSYDLRERAQK